MEMEKNILETISEYLPVWLPTSIVALVVSIIIVGIKLNKHFKIIGLNIFKANKINEDKSNKIVSPIAEEVKQLEVEVKYLKSELTETKVYVKELLDIIKDARINE